ncbi:MAG: phage tail sheath family protein [Desulfobacterales bacterium]|nr:phage tail sheath family protein [Desulfobacterales bacterium]
MATYKTPDVYVEEVSLFPPSVAEVATAIPAFIGHTQQARKIVANDLRLVPHRISSMTEYEQYFGKTDPLSFTVNIVQNTTTHEFTIQPIAEPTPTYLMYYCLKLFFANGGGPCYIVSVGDLQTAIALGDDSSGLQGGLKRLEQEDEPTLIVIPEAVRLGNSAHFFSLMNAALGQCHKLMDRFAIMDLHGQDVALFRGNIASDLDYLKYGAAYHPWLETSLNFPFDDTSVVIGTHQDQAGTDVSGGLAGTALGATTVKDQNNALYNQIKEALLKLFIKLPPSAAVAGVYARVDGARGVWKAPANVSLFNVVRPTQKITSEDQEDLNVDPTAGKSINAIRAFTGKGTMVWGARTLAGNDNEWRYVSVRRFFNMVEESIKKSTYWAVFEPNDANTWIKVKSMIENYLILKWRDGALAGAKPEHAFFVKIGLGETMTAVDVLEGRMNVEIGMAAVRPAEFIILKFSHKMQES